MKLVFLDQSTIGDASTLSLFKEFGQVVYYETTSPNEILERVVDANILLTNKVVIDKTIIDAAPHLQLICVLATGTNNVDIAYATMKKVMVKNVTDYSTQSVVQVTFGFLFFLLNHLAYFNDFVFSGKYSRNKIFSHLGREIRELHQMHFGIIGMGNIGSKVADIASAFGAKVSYYSTSGIDRNPAYERKDLKSLLSESDVVSIHAPLNEKTTRLITYEQLQWMKSTAILINMGRGGIIDEKDLAAALNENLIGAAGIDVYEQEPIDPHHPFLSLHNPEKLILTPHIGWSSKESRELLLEKTYLNIKEFLNNTTAEM